MLTRSLYIKITATLIFVITIASAVAVWWQHSHKMQALAPQSLYGDVPSRVSSWRVFQDLTFGFSVEYPSSWAVSTSTDSTGYYYSFHSRNHTSGILVTVWIENGGYASRLYPRPLTEQEVMGDLVGPGEGGGALPVVIASSSVVVGGEVPAEHYLIRYGEPDATLDTIVISHKGLIYSLDFGATSLDERAEFISSFQFER